MPRREISKSPYEIELEAGTYYLCSCGASKKHPICDGSHHGSDATPREFVLSDRTKVYLCACKHSKTSSFCDGSHKHKKKI